MVIFMAEVKCKFSPKFAIKVNKYVCRTQHLSITYNRGTTFIQKLGVIAL